jgi:hypothetical protein
MGVSGISIKAVRGQRGPRQTYGIGKGSLQIMLGGKIIIDIA